MSPDPSTTPPPPGQPAPPGRAGWLEVAGPILAAAALLAVFVVLAVASGPDSALSAWDRRVTDAFIAWRTPGLTHLFYALTLLGNTLAMAAFAFSVALLLVVWGRRGRAALVAGGLLIAWGISELAKAVVGRPRPPESDALIATPSSGSLPSSHALTTLVFLGLLVFLAFRWRRARAGGPFPRALAWAALGVATVIAGLIGVSRVYLGVHWLSDVLAGWSLGGAWVLALLAAVVTSRLLKSDASSPGCDGHVREKDAGSANSSAICATEDVLSHRPVRSGGRGFAFQQPCRVWQRVRSRSGESTGPPRAPARPAARVAAVVFAVALCVLALVVSARLGPLLTDL